MEIKSTAKAKLAFYESEILKLKEAVTKATEIRDDALNKLKTEGEIRVKPKMDPLFFEKEKERIEATMKVSKNLQSQTKNKKKLVSRHLWKHNKIN